MLQHIEGNILDLADRGMFDLVVQGCNCQNTMGSGLAKEIRERFPAAYAADQRTVKGDKSKLGTYTVGLGKRYNVINAYTQYHYLPRGIDHFEYSAFNNILNSLAVEYKWHYSYGFPYIGMGLAGGDPEIIIPMLEMFAEEMINYSTNVYLVKYA